MISSNKYYNIFAFSVISIFFFFQPVGFDIYYHLYYLNSPESAFVLNADHFIFGIRIHRYILLQYLSYLSFPAGITLFILTLISWFLPLRFLISRGTIYSLFSCILTLYLLVFWTPASISVGFLVTSLLLTNKNRISFICRILCALFSICFHPISFVLLLVLVLIFLIQKEYKLSFILIFFNFIFILLISIIPVHAFNNNISEVLIFNRISDYKIDNIIINNSFGDLRKPTESIAFIREPLSFSSFFSFFPFFYSKIEIIIVCFLLFLFNLKNLNNKLKFKFHINFVIFLFILLLSSFFIFKSFQNGSMGFALINNIFNKVNITKCLIGTGELVSRSALGLNKIDSFPEIIDSRRCISLPPKYVGNFTWPNGVGLNKVDFENLVLSLHSNNSIDFRYVIDVDGMYWVFRMNNIYLPNYDSIIGYSGR